MPMPNQLPRTLNRFDAAMMIIGNMIGIGIFATTGFYASYLSSPLSLFSIWLLGGLYAFCGALTYAELATRFPRAGGDYHFLKHAYHPLLGFLFGWSTFTVTYTGSAAAIAIGFAAYFSRILPEALQQWQMAVPFISFQLPLVKIVALLIALLLTWLNSTGIRRGAGFQNFFTLLGIATLLAFIGLGFSSGKGSWDHFVPFAGSGMALGEVSRLGVALVGVVFTYSGWTVLAYIAGEIREPRRSIPAAMAGAVLTVALLYILMNAVYLYAQPLDSMSGRVEVGYETLRILFGTGTGGAFALIIMLMVLSSLNATLLSGARIYYAMAGEGRFFRSAGQLHPRHRVPARSLWMQFGWIALLIVLGSFDQLLTYTVFVMTVFSFLSGVALFVLRRRNPGAETYRAWGYPVTQLIYLAISAWLMVNTFYHRPLEALWGILIVGLGVPFYYGWKKRETRGA